MSMTETVDPKRGPDPKLFGQVTVAVICVTLALALAVQWGRLMTRRRPKRLLAMCRYGSYAHVPVFGLSLGNALVMACIFVVLLVYLLAGEQYYRQGKWSPLGLRAGYIAAGLSPFVFTLGSRINPLAWATRISHERLMKYHQWGARAIFLFSMIHTGTMLRSKWDTIGELWAKEGTVSHFFTPDARLANGTVAIVVMAWIIFSSFANLRARSYEFFVVQHIITVLVLLISLLAHLQVDLKQGIKYYYASAAAWAFSVIVRFGLFARSRIQRGSGMLAKLETLPNDVTLLRIQVPRWFSWRPGQHVYLRLYGQHLFQVHPFTIATTAPIDRSDHDELCLMVKGRGGLTAHLAQAAAKNPTRPLRVGLEGPYGHLGERLLMFDEVLIIAGGIGCTFAQPLAQSLHAKQRAWSMVWTIRDAESVEWLDQALLDTSSLSVHVTGTGKHAELVIDSSGSQQADDPDEKDRHLHPAFFVGRPAIGQLVHGLVQAGPKCARKAVIVCGPPSLVRDVRAAVAAAQLGIIRGSSPTSELWLHTEGFQW